MTKAGRAHRVPLPAEALALLDGLPRLTGGLVFPGRGGKPMSGWTKRVAALREATAAAGMGGWRLHDLRRTVRTGLGRLGVEPQIAELLLNHAIGDELAATYDRGDYWQRRAEAAARWARHVAGWSAASRRGSSRCPAARAADFRARAVPGTEGGRRRAGHPPRPARRP